jgi:hypothetical protein
MIMDQRIKRTQLIDISCAGSKGIDGFSFQSAPIIEGLGSSRRQFQRVGCQPDRSRERMDHLLIEGLTLTGTY